MLLLHRRSGDSVLLCSSIIIANTLVIVGRVACTT